MGFEAACPARSFRATTASDEVDVIGDELWLFRLDEVGEVFEACLQLVERPLANLRNVDVHNRVGHFAP